MEVLSTAVTSFTAAASLASIVASSCRSRSTWTASIAARSRSQAANSWEETDKTEDFLSPLGSTEAVPAIPISRSLNMAVFEVPSVTACTPTMPSPVWTDEPLVPCVELPM